MEEIKYDKLDRMRNDILRDKKKVAKLQEQIKQKEAKLKEAEAGQILADVGAMNMSPEQLAQFLALIQSGQLNGMLAGNVSVPTEEPVIEEKASEEEEDLDYEEEEDFDNDEN